MSLPDKALQRPIELAYTATFREAADVESVAAITGLLGRLGYPVDRFTGFAKTHLPMLESARVAQLDAGILNPPCLVLDGEVFHGREHLPLITWMLTGKPGQPPV